ncbi:MAG: DUF2905 domain-containing protein [Candidatus Amoebophilus sp.]
MSRFLIILGSLLILLGILWPIFLKIGLGRLPGDIIIEKENFKFYFPITTSLLISVIISLIMWVLRNFLK